MLSRGEVLDQAGEATVDSRKPPLNKALRFETADGSIENGELIAGGKSSRMKAGSVHS